jgi:hypothetical protein
VTCVDAYEVRKRYRHARLHGWELKPCAVQHSRFQEVLAPGSLVPRRRQRAGVWTVARAANAAKAGLICLAFSKASLSSPNAFEIPDFDAENFRDHQN